LYTIWDWQDNRHYVIHLFKMVPMADGWHTQHFVGRPGVMLQHWRCYAGFDDVRVLAPDETGYYQPVIRVVAPPVSTSG
jgi:hypothetical protein